MRKLFLVWVFVRTPAVFVTRRDRRIVISRDTRKRTRSQHLDDFVRPWGVADEVAEVINRRVRHPLPDIAQDGFESRKVGVYIRDQRVSHDELYINIS